jgi:hypothetical protein
VSNYIGDITIEDEVANLQMGRPHVLLLGAGASKAALPNGDKNGRPVPVMHDVADQLGLSTFFPEDLRALAGSDFEAAYSELFEREDPIVGELNDRIVDYFGWLRLPDATNLYDYLLLCMREKDAIFTFNWDPFLVHARLRLTKLGVMRLPKLFFLHGNVAIGYCAQDEVSGITNRPGIIGQSCSRCGQPFAPSKLLFPVASKDYQDNPFTIREWKAARFYLQNCFMFTVFGYSAPKTDVEAVGLLKEAWGDVEERQLEQTEIICRPGADHEVLRATWAPFIHTHHYDIFDSFFDSWLANHPRRTGEAYWSQYLEAQFITDNPVPQGVADLAELVEWFRPLLAVEDAAD